MIDAFNLSEIYRVPVLFMADECVGHMLEKVVIPSADKLDIVERKYTQLPPDKYLPYSTLNGDLVPEMVKAGDGYKFHITAITHDERGYPAATVEQQQKLVTRLVNKIRLNAEHIVKFEEKNTEGADVVIVSYGITSRVASAAVEMARKKGMKVGELRLIVVWPFPEKRIRELAKKVKAFVVPELNMGKIYYEVERCAQGNAKVRLVPHAGGTVHEPEEIYKAILEAAG